MLELSKMCSLEILKDGISKINEEGEKIDEIIKKSQKGRNGKKNAEKVQTVDIKPQFLKG